jgi:hypothetical protein
LLIGLILLIGFSRLWLGVHTPQDVLSGLSIGLILVFTINPLINWAEKNTNRYLYLLAIINILILAALTYIIFFNTYRIDYIGGELLVDPKKQIYVTIIVYSYIMGLLNGCFLCRRFFPFNPKEVSVKRRIIRGIVGSIGIFLSLKLILSYIIMNIISLKIAVPVVFLAGLLITLIYPIIFQKCNKI